jgi:dTMP kinase
VGEVIRPLLKEGRFQTPLGELLGFCACRAELVATRVKDLLAQGVVVLMDRFHPTTTAYQGYAMDPSLVTLIEDITRATLKDRKPFAILFLNTPPDVCFERCKARGELDGIEARGLEFFQKAYAGYLRITAGPDYITLDGLLDPETIANQAIDAVEMQAAFQWGTRIH